MNRKIFKMGKEADMITWDQYKEKKLAELKEDDYRVLTKGDAVNHPTHYTSHPSGVEVIEITEHMNFCLGNAIKYIMRAEHKGRQIEDLKKAAWYINREIDRLERINNGSS